MIFNYFFLAFITSFFAMFFSIISRFRTTKHGIKFTHIYKMVLFAQTIPFLIISIFEIIAKVNGVAFVFPINILEFLTIFVFIISMFSIRKKNLKDVKKNWLKICLDFGRIYIFFAQVAQLDRVAGYEPVGRGFESSPARQKRA